MDDVHVNNQQQIGQNNGYPEGPYGNGEEVSESLSPIQRFIGVVLSPGKVMQDLARRPRILFPFLFMALISLVPYILLFQTILDVTITQLEQSFAMSGILMTPDGIRATAIGSLIGAAVLVPIIAIVVWLIGAAIFMAAAKILKGAGTYKSFLSITGYAFIIKAFTIVIATVMGFVTGEFLTDAAAVTSVASFLDAENTSAAFYAVASQLEIFNIWYYIVVSIGISKVSGFSLKKSIIMVAVLCAIGLTISAGISHASQLMLESLDLL